MTKEEILERTGFDLVRAKEIYGWLNEGYADAFLKHLSLMKRKFAEELSEAEGNGSVKGMEYANGELSAVVEAMEWLQRKEDAQ